MKTLLLTDVILLILVCFFAWLYPRAGQRTRDVFGDWWLRFSELDHTKVGCYLAGILTQRMDTTFGKHLLSKRYLILSFILSQCVFLLLFLWIALAWGLVSVCSTKAIYEQALRIVHSVRHCIIPLMVTNTIFDVASLGVTREILRKASEATTLRMYGRLLGIDFLIATTFVLLSALFFSNFYFSPSVVVAVLLFIIYLSFVPCTFFLVLSPLFIIVILKDKQREMDTWVMIGIVIFISVLAGIIIFLTVKRSFYIPYLSLDTSDVTVILILAVSLTAAIPTALNLIALFAMFIVRVFSGPSHSVVSHLLLRLAETPRGVVYICVAILAAIKDILTVVLIK